MIQANNPQDKFNLKLTICKIIISPKVIFILLIVILLRSLDQ